ncbi:MAG TPA: NAD(P)/FAD-dependent oxidoreductase, partial [Longimicrobiaceae bacterium]|nr:NAD(P)/FAD-dependent oxidoreductase [Longimicrobiaceae bacterium]
DHTAQHVRIAIVGSGFGGIGTAIRLKQEGIEDFLIFERAEEVGGVWRDNRYPGCACDVQSRLYSFSFAPNPRWSRRYSPQSEIWEYLRRCTREFGILPHIRFGQEVRSATWDEARVRWRIQTSEGSYTAEVLVAAPGALSEPRIPELPGLETFQGRVLHSAQWDEEVELAGRRVAVVGTGASAIQIVPAIQPVVERLVLFQRTPPWIVPRHDCALGDRVGRWIERLPLLGRLLRSGIYGSREIFGLPFRHPRLSWLTECVARRHLELQVPDPALREKLTPDYTMGCKRILLSDDFYPALMQPNVELVESGVVELRPYGIVGADGVERAVDVVVFATGFQVTEFPFGERIRAKQGRALAEVWGASPRAHLGTTVAGFPNLFILQGPNTGLGHTSVILMIEAQIEHLVNALRYMEAHSVHAVEPREEAQEAFVREVDRKMEGTVWTSGGCRSWYLDETGRNSTLWPGSVGSFRRRVAPFRPGEYRLRPVAPPAPRRRRERVHA